MVFVYILRSERDGRYYIGWSVDVAARLARHNAGLVKATRGRGPWMLVYKEEYLTGTEARRREWYLKRMKSRVLLEKLIGSAG